MGKTQNQDDQIAAMRGILARLCASDLTLSEAASLRQEMTRLLESKPVDGAAAGHSRASSRAAN